MSTSQPAQNQLPGHRPDGWMFLAEIATQLGFAAIGVTPAAPLPAASVDTCAHWLAANHHAGMEYLSSGQDARKNSATKAILPGASTVVMAALPYGDGAEQTGLWQAIARYARGVDYHRTVADRLRAVVKTVAQHQPVDGFKICVDSAPLQERSLAILAGLGAQGLSGNLIVPDVGPRVVLGAILLAGPPSPEPFPVPEHATPSAACGACRICIEACPTGALNGDGTLDARRCLAYHTVENRAQHLEADIRRHLTTMFGCDLCTTSCPRHRPDVPSGLEATDGNIGTWGSLEDLTRTSNRKLSRLFGGTTLERTGGRTLKRNATYAIENLGSQPPQPEKD